MADTTLYGRLKRLFNSNVIVRKVGKDKLRVVDNDHLQSVGNVHNSKFIDRFTRLHGVRPNSLNTYNANYNYFSSKTELYTDYEVMDQDSIISSALDIYADETVMKDDFGDVLRITSNDENIKKILHNLFYDILNIEFNLWPWVRNMCKYGDLYLKLDIQEEIGIVNVTPLSAYEIIREEGMDPNNPYHVQFKQLGGGNITYETFEIAHFRNLTDSNFLPYGKSMIEGGRKVWKQLTLMEDAMLIHRIMRAPEKRIFKIDVGNIPPNEVDNYMQKIMNTMKKTPYVDEKTGDYNLKFNMMNMLEDYFLPVRGGQSGTEIDTLAGMEFTGIDDIEYLRNKMMASLKVPKAFIGYEEGLGGKATLAAEDVRFARTIERIQRVVISELYKIAIIHLTSQGYADAELTDFELTMTSPSTIYEQEKLTLYATKVSLAGDMIEKKLISKDWVYKNIFNFTPEDIEDIDKGLIKDQKDSFRLSKISEEGEDPANPVPKKKEEKEGEGGTEGEGGAEGETEANPFAEGIDEDLLKKYDMRAKDTKEDKERKKPEVPEGGWPGAGRPKETMKYNTHDHPRGYDPTGRIAWKNARNESIDLLKKKYGLNKLVTKKTGLINEQSSMLDESNIIPEEI
ncbi:MAG: portal protein [Flavobacterium sp.]